MKEGVFSCTLTASPAAGYSFVRWTKNGTQVSTSASYSFTVTENASYVAVFSLNSYSISASASPSSGGNVTGAGSYSYGSNCTLTATPNTGYSFVRWTKNGTQVSTSASYSFTVTENASYVAVFSLNSYTVSASANPSAGGTVSGAGTYSYGSNCNLIATSNPGYTFTNWTKNGIVVSTEATYGFTVTENANYVANFSVLTTHWPDFNSTNYYDHATIVAYIPINGEYITTGDNWADLEVGAFVGEDCRGHEFMVDETNWGDEYPTIQLAVYYENAGEAISFALYDHATGIEYTLWTANMTLVTGTDYEGIWLGEDEVVLNFSQAFAINATAYPSAGGSVSGAGNYANGATCTLTATASEGYVFINWREDGEVVSTKTAYNFTVTSDRDLVANFQLLEDYIVFADSNVKAICVANWDTNGDGELSYAEAAAVTDLGTVFKDNYSIHSFDELQYFTGLTSIAGSAFSRCYYLTSVEIPDSVTSIGDFAFLFCSLTGSLIIPDAVTSIGTDAFYGCSSLTGDLVIPNSMTSIGFGAFISCSGLTGTLTIPNSVTSIGTYAFRGCNGLTSVYYTGDVSQWCEISFGDEPFNYAHDLYINNQLVTDLVIPNSVTTIGNCAFCNCNGLTSLEIPNSVTSIGNNAFYGCSGLTGLLTIPNSITSIGGYAFANCIGLTSIISYATTPPTLGTGVFDNIPTTITVYVPCFSLESYSEVNGWNQFTNYQGMDCPSYNYEISATSNPAEGGTINGTGAYECGTACTLAATANEDYTFVCWTEDGEMVSSEAEYSFFVLRDRSLVAHFSLPFTITVESNPTEGGTIEGAGEYDYNTTCTLTATPNENYTFMYWTENGQQVSSNASYSFTVTTNRNLVAHFTLPLTITTESNPTEGGTIEGAGEYDYNTTCTLTATPNPGYLFSYWTKNGNVVSYFSPYSFTVTEEATYEALFEVAPEGVCVGNPESGNQYLPSFSYYNYTLSQQIYTASEIGTVGMINSMSFYNIGGTKTRNYDIYLVHTDKTTFDSNYDWIAVTEDDRVFSGDVTMINGCWNTIEFDMPFDYNGVDNLALIVDDNSGSWTGTPHMQCRVYHTEDNQAIRIYSDGTNYDPYNPSGYGGTRYSEKNQIILGIYDVGLQLCSLFQGTNWFSTYLEITLQDLQMALVAALGSNATNTTIKAKDGTSTTFNGTRWRGTLNTLDVAQMYKIKAPAACTFTLEGIIINPAEHPVTIQANASNWIGFPLGQGMTVTDAFAGFAQTGDKIKIKNGNSSTYNGTRWRGTLTNLEPGQGYIYNSGYSQDRTLVFPTSK